MHFSSWDNSKEWSTTMPEEEDIECITMGEGWVAVATDTRNVRLFSITGIQKEMFSLPGPVVCMAGHTCQLIVVYHRGMGMCEFFINRVNFRLVQIESTSRRNMKVT